MSIILSAYLLNSLGKMNAQSRVYQNLNFVGALLFVINLSYMKAWPSVALNIIWAGIALVTLIKISKKSHN